MHDIPVNELRSMTIDELERVSKRIADEMLRRRNEDRAKKINAFQRAWNDLKDAGIRISYCEEYEEDIVHLDLWDGFNFD